MSWPWRRRHPGGTPTEDARAAVEQIGAAARDTDRLGEHVAEVTRRAHEVARKAEEVRARNHFAEAVIESMRRVRHP